MEGGRGIEGGNGGGDENLVDLAKWLLSIYLFIFLSTMYILTVKSTI